MFTLKFPLTFHRLVIQLRDEVMINSVIGRAEINLEDISNSDSGGNFKTNVLFLNSFEGSIIIMSFLIYFGLIVCRIFANIWTMLRIPERFKKFKRTGCISQRKIIDGSIYGNNKHSSSAEIPHCCGTYNSVTRGN